MVKNTNFLNVILDYCDFWYKMPCYYIIITVTYKLTPMCYPHTGTKKNEGK